MATHEHRKSLVRSLLLLIIFIFLSLLIVACRSEQKILEGPPVDEALADLEDEETFPGAEETDTRSPLSGNLPSTTSRPTPYSQPLPRSLQASTGVTEILEDVVAIPQTPQLNVTLEIHDLVYDGNDLQRFSFTIKNSLDKKLRPFIDIYAIDEETGNDKHIKQIDIEEVLPRSTFVGDRVAIKGSVDQINQEVSFRLMYINLQKGKTMLDEEIVMIDASREFKGIRR